MAYSKLNMTVESEANLKKATDLGIKMTGNSKTDQKHQ
jgi:hypothetical protein